MSIPRAVLLTIAVLATPLFAFAADAQTPEEAAAAAKVAAAASAAAAKVGCAVPAPLPLLDKTAYPDHAFRYGEDNTATEKASNGSVAIEIEFAGCQDGFEHSFSFTESAPATTYDNRDHWLAFAAEQVKALKTWRRGREDVKDLLDFLSGAKIATTRKSDSEIRLEVCRDGSPAAEDGCSFKSGGGWRFAVRKMDGGGIEVYVSRYLALEAKRPAKPRP